MKWRHLILISVSSAAVIGLIRPMLSGDKEFVQNEVISKSEYKNASNVVESYSGNIAGMDAKNSNTESATEVDIYNKFKTNTHLIPDNLKLIGTIVDLNRNYSRAILLLDGRTIVKRQINEEIRSGITLREINQQNAVVQIGGELVEIKLTHSDLEAGGESISARSSDGGKVEIGRAPNMERNTNEYDQKRYWTNVSENDYGQSLTIGRKPSERDFQDLDQKDEHNTTVDEIYNADDGIRLIVGKPIVADKKVEEGSPITPMDYRP